MNVRQAYMLMRAFLATLVIILIPGRVAEAAVPYSNYTYSYVGDPIAEPQAYVPDKVISGEALGVGAFRQPKDIFVARSGKRYILDTGNNRIVVTDTQWRVIRVIASFENNGKQDSFNAPEGIFVSPDNQIYVADTGNGRIVRMKDNGTFLNAYGKPEAIGLTNQYEPVKIGVDSSGRMFVVAKNVNRGMIELDREGQFNGYFGAVKVSPSPGDLIWKRIATKEQRQRMVLTVPTEYNNLTVDRDGFVYGTISALDGWQTMNQEAHPVRKMNPLGNDILSRNGFSPPIGDIEVTYSSGNPLVSQLTDVAAGDYGLYSVLDQRRGRVFTYDTDGNLLFVFGGLGSTFGNFGSVDALDVLEEQMFVVLDGKYSQLIIFKPTVYGQMIREAVKLQSERKYDLAAQKWAAALQFSNSELAHIGMGKVLYLQGHYKEAMRYFKLGNDRELYSKAFKSFRKEWIDNHFAGVILWLSAIVILLVSAGNIRASVKRSRGAVS